MLPPRRVLAGAPGILAPMSDSFLDRIVRAPIPSDARALEIARERWSDAKAKLARSGAETFAALDASAPAQKLLDGVFANSPYLTRLILADPSWIAATLARPPEVALDEIVGRLAGEISALDNAAAMRALRRAKARVALLTALADLGGVFGLKDVTGYLTRFADASVNGALRWLLSAAAEKGHFKPPNAGHPEVGSGLIILAMGKYGAFELNYSSDIDLIALFDPETFPAAGEPAPFAIRLVKDLVRMLQSRTEDGYVFRVDLRLRPDGNASPVAISVASAELYYESAGQNWERAAMIKARACAGDIPAGEQFLASLRPYVWRKNLDYAAIEDIHSIKRQIHATKGHGEIAIAGHNLKLGRGGIREIEFFAQTQQLILGGRMPELRVRATCDALDRLAQQRLIEHDAGEELKESYVFLREIEHRLQMVDDEQTHTLPQSEEGVAQIAHFAGFESATEFETTLRAHLTRVQGHYAHLFASAEPLSADAGSLVFTGVEDDPETLKTIAGLGFKSPQEISARIRGWHHGRIRATRSARARERLTRLVPLLLQSLGSARDPDAAFAEFARFVEALPTGVQIFSLLISNAWLLDLLAEIFSLSPRLTRVLAERPAILDSLINAEFLRPGAIEAAPDTDLAQNLAQASTLEDALDAARIFARERQFRVAVATLEGGLEPRAAGEAFTQIAEITVAGLAIIAEAETAWKHGRVPGAEWVVLGLGKLGGREMTATSDLDLIFVYDFDPAHEQSIGKHALHATQYYGKLGQRLISLLTVPTREGRLYEVDMRLRPSGRAGPVAVTLERLTSYHASHAWVYEQMALSRARVIAGSPLFGARVNVAVRELLTAKRDLAKLSSEALDMRARLETAKPARDPWSLKFVRGGLVDLEYIAQILLLALAHEHPDVLVPSTAAVFERLAALDLIEETDAADLLVATRLLQALSQVLRIAYDQETSPANAGLGLKARLAEVGEAADFAALEAKLIATQSRVRELFDRYVRLLPAQLDRWEK